MGLGKILSYLADIDPHLMKYVPGLEEVTGGGTEEPWESGKKGLEHDGGGTAGTGGTTTFIANL
jgi:hypothetical protein